MGLAIEVIFCSARLQVGIFNAGTCPPEGGRKNNRTWIHAEKIMNKPVTSLSRFAICAAATLALASPGNKFAAAQQPARTGPFTAEQASAGRAIYGTTCASCHQPDMKGTFEAPPLAGPNFMNTWRNRPTSDLFTRSGLPCPSAIPVR